MLANGGTDQGVDAIVEQFLRGALCRGRIALDVFDDVLDVAARRRRRRR